MNAEWRVECGEWSTLAEQRKAACRLLGQMVGRPVSVEHDGAGAPLLADEPDLHISVSHCRKAVAVAMCDEGMVGIDVECRRKVSDGLAVRVCTDEELASVRASDDPTMAFLRLWTRKEAVLKMRGTGIKGFGSMVGALVAGGCTVRDVDTGSDDVVAAVAVKAL